MSSLALLQVWDRYWEDEATQNCRRDGASLTESGNAKKQAATHDAYW